MSRRVAKKKRKRRPEKKQGDNVVAIRTAGRKKRRKKLSAKKRIAVFVIVVIVLMILSSMNSIIRLKQQEYEARQEVERLTAQRDQLKERVAEIDSNEYIEQQARNWLKMAKKGDLVYILNGDSIQQDEDITQEQEEADASRHQKASNQGL